MQSDWKIVVKPPNVNSIHASVIGAGCDEIQLTWTRTEAISLLYSTIYYIDVNYLTTQINQ